MFDQYVSLGANCEVAFQFRRVLGKDFSSFFQWNVTLQEPLKNLLSSRFSGIAKRNMLRYPGSGTLVEDLSYNYHFHWAGSLEGFPGDTPDELFEENERKLQYLADKFIRNLQSTNRMAFFYALREPVVDYSFFSDILKILDSLAERRLDAAFIVLSTVDKSELPADALIEPRLYFRNLRRFAPWEDATDGHVLSWDAVFREFPHNEEMRLAGY